MSEKQFHPEGKGEDERFDVLEVVAARNSGNIDAERQKLESFAQEAQTREQEQELAPSDSQHGRKRHHTSSISSKANTTEQETQEDERGGNGDNDNDSFMIKVVRERQKIHQAEAEATGAISQPSTELKQQPPTAGGTANHPGAYSAAPGTDPQRTTDLRLSLVGLPSSTATQIAGLDPELGDVTPTTLSRKPNVVIQVPPGAESVFGPDVPTEAGPSLPTIQSDSFSGGGLVEADPVSEEDDEAMQKATQVDTEQMKARTSEIRRQNHRKLALAFLGIAVVIIVIVMTILGATGSFSKDPPEIIETTPPPFNATQSPTPSPSQAPTQYLVVLREELNLPTATLDKIDANSASAQYRAFDWLESNRELYDGLLPWQKQQLFALLTFYFDFSGPKWPKAVAETWLEESDVCRWYSAEYGGLDEDGDYLDFEKLNTDIQQATARDSCTLDGQFQALVMAQLPLEEEIPHIPAEISLLTHLSALSLPHNKVNRSLVDLLPLEIYEMENLDYINFWNNFLSGPLPSEFGSLTKLDTIGLRDNQLTGSIPASWSKLTNMKDLDVANNRLTDSLPDFFSILGSMTKLTSLNAFSNWFVGPLPPEIGLLTSLENLDLKRTAGLNGTIPTEIGLLTSLERLNLYRNAGLYGTIPTEIGLLTSLTFLDLSHCSFTGEIPSEIGLLTGLETLYLMRTKFSGTVPREIFLLTNLKRVYFDTNQNLSGSIPTEIGLQTALEKVQMYECALGGTVPTEIGHLMALQHFWIGDNPSINGRIPSELWSLPALTSLGLARNSFTGPVPSEIGMLQALTNQTATAKGSGVNIGGNALTGSIPSEIGELVGLQYLFLGGNTGVSGGGLPSEAGMLTSLVKLVVSGSSLLGSLPSELGLLTGLAAVELSECTLTGSIPSEMALMAGVKMLYLGLNALVGSIPSEIGLMENLAELMLHNNSLSGSIPERLVGNESSLGRLSLENNPELSGVVPEMVCSLGYHNASEGDYAGLSFDCEESVLCGCEWCIC